MDRVKMIFLMSTFTVISAIMAEPQSSYGAPSSSFSGFRNTNSNFNRNQDASGFQNFRNGITSSSSFSGSLRDADTALLADSIPGPKVFRHISLFVAPQDTQQAPQTRVIRTQGSPDKHVNIIFVKAPSTSNSQQTEVILPEQPVQKTLVYVLVKKPEVNENNIKILGQKPTKPPAPEVYFIKYKKENGAAGQVGGNSFGTPSLSSGNSGGIRSSGSYSSSYGAPL